MTRTVTKQGRQCCRQRLVITAAAALLAAASTARADDTDAFRMVMRADFARKAGEMAVAAKLCEFKFKKSQEVIEKLPQYYLDLKREDLLGQVAVAVEAFQKRFENDPVTTCNQARANYPLAFETDADAAEEQAAEGNAQVTASIMYSSKNCATTLTEMGKNMVSDIAAKTDQDLLAAANQKIDADVKANGLQAWCQAWKRVSPLYYADSDESARL